MAEATPAELRLAVAQVEADRGQSRDRLGLQSKHRADRGENRATEPQRLLAGRRQPEKLPALALPDPVLVLMRDDDEHRFARSDASLMTFVPQAAPRRPTYAGPLRTASGPARAHSSGRRSRWRSSYPMLVGMTCRRSRPRASEMAQRPGPRARIVSSTKSPVTAQVSSFAAAALRHNRIRNERCGRADFTPSGRRHLDRWPPGESQSKDFVVSLGDIRFKCAQ